MEKPNDHLLDTEDVSDQRIGIKRTIASHVSRRIAALLSAAIAFAGPSYIPIAEGEGWAGSQLVLRSFQEDDERNEPWIYLGVVGYMDPNGVVHGVFSDSTGHTIKLEVDLYEWVDANTETLINGLVAITGRRIEGGFRGIIKGGKVDGRVVFEFRRSSGSPSFLVGIPFRFPAKLLKGDQPSPSQRATPPPAPPPVQALPPVDNTQNLTREMDIISADLDRAFEQQDYQRAADLFDRVFAILKRSGFTYAAEGYAVAADVYNNTRQLGKVEMVCDEGEKKAPRDDMPAYLDMLHDCATHLIDEHGNPAKGFRLLMMYYGLKAGTTDKKTLLRQIALSELDARNSVIALMYQNKGAEASGLLAFYLQENPSLVPLSGALRDNHFWDLAMALSSHKYNAPEALRYIYNRRSEARTERQWEKFFEIAVPVVAAGVLIYEGIKAGERREEREAEKERRRQEAEDRRRQAEHDAENARRRAQGRPSIEEEESQRANAIEAERARTRARCFEWCTTNYHNCLGRSDWNCCGDNAPFLGCVTNVCPTLCDTWLSDCRKECD